MRRGSGNLGNAISIEKFLSVQIAIANGSDKYLLFFRMCKHPSRIIPIGEWGRSLLGNFLRQ